jgi:hypothetical protein
MDAKERWIQENILSPSRRPIRFQERETLRHHWVSYLPNCVLVVLHFVASFLFSKRKTEVTDPLLDSLRSENITLTGIDIAKIPCKVSHIDIFVRLIQLEIAFPEDHPSLIYLSFTEYIKNQANEKKRHKPLMDHIQKDMILRSGQMLFIFLSILPMFYKKRSFYLSFLQTEIKHFLESPAGKELSWVSCDLLKKLEKQYIEMLGVEDKLTRVLQEEWIPQLKALHLAEKSLQKNKMDPIKEELMMVCWHPDRVRKYLEMGMDIEDL